MVDALLDMLANNGESLNGVKEARGITGLGDVLLTEGMMREQNRRVLEDLNKAQQELVTQTSKGG